MRLRPATPDDADALERIRIRGWQVAYRHVFPCAELDAMPIDSSRWREWLTAGFEHGHACVVAEDDGSVVGWATFGFALDPDDRYGELRGLYVDPDRWGRGAGRALLEHAETELARSWDEALLWTLEDNPRTRRFYEAAGWRFDGTTGVLEKYGVKAPIVHYVKRLRRSASRS
jgi:GNAT superfamily N-acetyltransferase